MGVMCEIYVHKTREGVHRAGQDVSGFIRYAVDKPTDSKGIVVSLIGKGDVRWSDKTFDKEETYWATEEYVSQHINILPTRSEDPVKVEIGSYECPFRFTLPQNLPSSFKGFNGTINYFIQLNFKKPGLFTMNKVFKKELVVYGNVNPIAPEEPVIYGLQKKLLKPFSIKEHIINLKVEIDNCFVSPGANIKLKFSVNNNTDVAITIKVEICETVTYKANFGKTNSSYKVIKESNVVSDEIREESHCEFSTIVPTQSNLYSIQHSNIIDKYYALNVTAKLPMPHINEFVTIPIAIGEKVGTNVELIPPEEPPSYWEAMAEDKREQKSGKERKEMQ